MSNHTLKKVTGGDDADPPERRCESPRTVSTTAPTFSTAFRQNAVSQIEDMSAVGRFVQDADTPFERRGRE
jgi:hypothetical protein